MKIIIGTGDLDVNLFLKNKLSNNNEIDVIEYIEDLEDIGFADIFILTSNLEGKGTIPSALLRLKMKFPASRIIYIKDHINLENETEVIQLNSLISVGIYDIVQTKAIDLSFVEELIENRRTKKSVEPITRALDNFSRENKSKIKFLISKENEEDAEEQEERNNMFSISSIKPGTGKSFVSANIATAIAEFGEDIDGRRPRVGLIEADLQNLSVGTLLQIEDKNKNVKKVMDMISTVISPKGEFIVSDEEVQQVIEDIKKCFLPYERVKNLKALVGSQIEFKEFATLTLNHYSFLVNSVIDEFDVLIIDTNSALTHVSTLPLLTFAKTCYYVLNLDYNNVRNNSRYQSSFVDMGINHKVKYILNEDLPNEKNLKFNSKLIEDSGYELEAKIPMIEKHIFLNSLYEGVPIILDKSEETLLARQELFKIANQIHPIKGYSEKTSENKDKKKKKLFFGK